MPSNPTIFQAFEWHTPSKPPGPEDTHYPTSHYTRLTHLLPSLANLGITHLWLPPGCKANNPRGNGYDIYDFYDLGEFEQKGSRSTKWGSREELDYLLAKSRECGVQLIWDAVLNHKAGADGTEECWAVEVGAQDRRYEIASPKKIEAWLRYDLHGREKDGELKYSQFRWRPEHFNGVDWDQKAQKKAIYKLIDDPSTETKPFAAPKRPAIHSRRSSSGFWRSVRRATGNAPIAPPRQRPGKGWANDVDTEHGNNDYLMFSNIDYTHADVRADVTDWARWMLHDVGVDGFRLDAVQHFSFAFTRDWIQAAQQACRNKYGRDVFVVGEVWTGERKRVMDWLDTVQVSSGPRVYAYDSPLLYSFSRISEAVAKGTAADLSTILRGSLLETQPEAAVTLVTNHDTQPGQASYTPMSRALKPLFYAFILLRREGVPCVFWGDLFGTEGPHAEPPVGRRDARSSVLADLMLCRRLFAHGGQRDYARGSKDCLAWTRQGDAEQPGCALVCSLRRHQAIEMAVGGKAGDVWDDVLGNCSEEVVIDRDGRGCFPCAAMNVSVWITKDAQARERFPTPLDVGRVR